MSDVIETEQTEETAPEGTVANPDGSVSETVEETPTPKVSKRKVIDPHACLCQVFMLIDLKDADTAFTTECESTTKSTFAQGHDARLVSFLVQGQLDGYTPVRTDGEDGARVQYESAGHAAASASELLGAKADKALQNASERETAKQLNKAEREAAKAKAKAEKEEKATKAKADKEAAKEAAKAAGPKEVAAKVVAGSQTGDAVKPQPTRPEPEEGEEAVTIKVGRTEIPATLNADKTEVRWVDATGKPQNRPADTVRILAQA